MRGSSMQTTERTAHLLLAFTEGKPILGVSELARRLGLAKSVVHRNLGTLVEVGLVARDPGSSRYCLGPRAVELGFAALGTADIRTLALPVMTELRERTTETVTLSMRAGWERVYVAQVESRQVVRMSVEIGRRFPLFAGASGRATLSGLSDEALGVFLRTVTLKRLTPATITSPSELRASIREARARGYAASIGERDSSAASVAAPVRAHGSVVGALSICGPASRFTPERVTCLVAPAIQGANAISDHLGSGGTHDSL